MQQVDSKFITARYVPCDEVSVKTVFLGIASSDLGGAKGHLDSFTTCIKDIGVETDKLVGITTDGENANTGKMLVYGSFYKTILEGIFSRYGVSAIDLIWHLNRCRLRFLNSRNGCPMFLPFGYNTIRSLRLAVCPKHQS